MKKDSLYDEVVFVKKWCKDNNIGVFLGIPERNNISEILWESEEEGSVVSYLTVLKYTDVKILVVSVEENNIDVEDEKILTYQQKLSNEEQEEFNEALQSIKKNKGMLVSYKLCFFYNNVSYEFVQYVDWNEDYNIVLIAYESGGYEDSEDVECYDIEELADKFTSNQEYIDSKNFSQRGQIIEALSKQENITDRDVVLKIKMKANDIYESIIKPKKEKEIKKSVLELKRQDLKKVEIASRLGISTDMVNKFYYADDNYPKKI